MTINDVVEGDMMFFRGPDRFDPVEGDPNYKDEAEFMSMLGVTDEMTVLEMNPDFPILNADTAQMYKDLEELKQKYFRKKYETAIYRLSHEG